MTEVFAEEGSGAFLPCKFDPSTPNPATVVWTKHNKGYEKACCLRFSSLSASTTVLPLIRTSVAVFRTVWRKTQSGLQFWGTSWLHKKTPRVQCPHYRFLRGDYSLQINSVKLEDAGLFSCRVETADEVLKHQVMLRIIQGIKTKPSPQISVKTHNPRVSDVRNTSFFCSVHLAVGSSVGQPFFHQL